MSKKGNVIIHCLCFVYPSIHLSIKRFVKTLEVVYHLVRSRSDKKALGYQDLFVMTLEAMCHLVRSESNQKALVYQDRFVKKLEVVYNLVRCSSWLSRYLL